MNIDGKVPRRVRMTDAPAELLDGRTGIYRADPMAVPEPVASILVAIAFIATLAHRWGHNAPSRGNLSATLCQ